MTFDELAAVISRPRGPNSVSVSGGALRRIHAHLVASGVDVEVVLAGTAKPTDKVSDNELLALSNIHGFCWHCYDSLADRPDAPICHSCPHWGDCDEEECDMPGCLRDRPNVPPLSTDPSEPLREALRQREAEALAAYAVIDEVRALAKEWRSHVVDYEDFQKTAQGREDIIQLGKGDTYGECAAQLTAALDAIEAKP